MNRKNKKQYDTESRNMFAPANARQAELVDSIRLNPITVVSGPAGTGKTLFSLQTLYQMYKSGLIDQILIIRLITESTGEKLGALPGEKEDKLSPYMGPIQDNIRQMLPAGEVDALISKNKLEVLPVMHCRGRSFADKGIIVEESQNLTDDQVVTIATRLGKGSRMVFNGDPFQADFAGRNGMYFLEELFNDMRQAHVVKFFDSDVVRHSIIPDIVKKARAIRRSRQTVTLKD